MNKIKVCSAMLTRCEFNNASVRVHFLFPSLIVMSKTWLQYKERSTALSLLNSPLVVYGLCVYQTHISGERLQSQWSSVVFISLKQYFPPYIQLYTLPNIKKTTLLHFRAVFTSTQVFLKERKNVVSHLLQKN